MREEAIYRICRDNFKLNTRVPLDFTFRVAHRVSIGFASGDWEDQFSVSGLSIL